jgi:hypothetical protein
MGPAGNEVQHATKFNNTPQIMLRVEPVQRTTRIMTVLPGLRKYTVISVSFPSATFYFLFPVENHHAIQVLHQDLSVGSPEGLRKDEV